MLTTLRCKISLAIIFALFNLCLHAQTAILNESMLTQASFNTFTNYSVLGVQMWSQSTQYGAVMSGFSSGQSNANEDWLISPAINLAQVNNVKLNFEHTRGPLASMNAGVELGWYKAYATNYYTGNPSTTQWVELTGMNNTITGAWNYIPSGDLTIPAAAKSAVTRIAFRYQSSASQSATWEIKNIKVTGQPAGTAGFKITNWNTEWLGCTDNGPSNEGQQLANVASAMMLMDSDVYCLQEISNTPTMPTMSSLINIMGPDTWAYAMIPENTGDCNQRQAIIYKKAKVQFVSALQLSAANPFHYNWSNGRLPAVYNVNLVSGSTLVPLTLVNIHAKASNDLESYNRRLSGADGLKTILDGSNYNTRNVVIVGDFNDWLIGTKSATECVCTDSPFKNFMDDTANYTGITQNLYDGIFPVIENIIVSNELADNYVTGSAAREEQFDNYPGFSQSTSDHLPVSMFLSFSETAGTGEVRRTNMTLYPNPVSHTLNITATSDLTENFTTIYDITGRQVFNEKFSGAVNVSALPSGVYIVKIGEVSRKFVKN